MEEIFNRFDTSKVVTSKRFLKIIFLGNSLTYHPPIPESGWINSNGMAASCVQNDYAHITLSRMQIEEADAYIENFAELERVIIQDETKIKLNDLFLKLKKQSIVVLQFGDNILDSNQGAIFFDNMKFLITILKNCADKIVMLSTYWADSSSSSAEPQTWTESPKDLLIKHICNIYDLNFIYIGDIFNSVENIDRQSKGYLHDGIDRHPQDWGMLQIANRLMAVLSVNSN